MISRRPKLQRQRKIFKHKGKTILRPKQMNINVATWGRLMKRDLPAAQSSEVSSGPSSQSSESPRGEGRGKGAVGEGRGRVERSVVERGLEGSQERPKRV